MDNTPAELAKTQAATDTPAQDEDAGTGQGPGRGGTGPARSGDGYAWTADALSQGRENASNTHAELRTKHTEGQTRVHSTGDPTEQTQRSQGVDLGSAGCLLVYGGLERDTQVLNERLQRGAAVLGACTERQPAGRPGAAGVVPVEEHVSLAGSRFFAQWEMCGDICSRGSPGSSEQRQMKGPLGQQGVTAQGPGAGSGKGFLRRGEGKGQGEGSYVRQQIQAGTFTCSRH